MPVAICAVPKELPYASGVPSGKCLEFAVAPSSGYHEGICSGGKVNWLIDGFGGERPPAIDLAHVDLARGEQRPEQHCSGVRGRQHGLPLDPPLERSCVMVLHGVVSLHCLLAPLRRRCRMHGGAHGSGAPSGADVNEAFIGRFSGMKAGEIVRVSVNVISRFRYLDAPTPRNCGNQPSRLIQRSSGAVPSCGKWGIVQVTPASNIKFCFTVAPMSRAPTNYYLDQYEAAVDEIIASCNGDLRGAVRALMLANEQLEQKLQRISEQLNTELSGTPQQTVVH
jgi:hypothetical protein